MSATSETRESAAEHRATDVIMGLVGFVAGLAIAYQASDGGQFSLDAITVLLATVLAGVVVAAALLSGTLSAGRVLVTAQAGLWLVLLIHGGSGLVFAPLALVAAAVARRRPVPATVLLACPLVLLVVGWIPLLPESLVGFSSVAAFLLLTVPAVTACVTFILHRTRPGGR